MGYSISRETHERIEANRAAGRLCAGSSRCSSRATRMTIALLWDDECLHCNTRLHLDRGVWVDDTEGDCCSGADDGANENEPHEHVHQWRWSVMVMCKKHADQMVAWPAYVNGAQLSVLGLARMSADDIEAQRVALEARPITPFNIAEARHLMRVDAARREAARKAMEQGR